MNKRILSVLLPLALAQAKIVTVILIAQGTALFPVNGMDD